MKLAVDNTKPRTALADQLIEAGAEPPFRIREDDPTVIVDRNGMEALRVANGRRTPRAAWIGEHHNSVKIAVMTVVALNVCCGFASKPGGET